MPKFVSDILAKAGLTVDGVVTLNNTATGQTPLANDNSTKLATTAWVRGFVTPYTLPIATSTTLGGVKIGNGIAVDANGVISIDTGGITAIRSEYTLTATAGQTVFTVPNGYTPGLLDIYINGVHLGPDTYTATNGTTITLADAATVGGILDIYTYNPLLDGLVISSDQLQEGTTNLFFTPARAQASVSGTAGRITYTAGQFDLATSGVTAGNYGSSSAIPTITVDVYGRITNISTTAVQIVTTLAGLSDVALTSLANDDLLRYNSSTSKWQNISGNTYALDSNVVHISGNETITGIKVFNANTGFGSAAANPKAELQMGARTAFFTTSGINSNLGNNVYFDGTQFRRIAADNDAPLIQLHSDGYIAGFFQTDVLTTADSIITYAERFRFNKAGNFLLGTTTDSGYKATISGSVNDVLSGSLLLTNTSSGTSAAAYLGLQAVGAGGFIGMYGSAYSNASVAGRLVVGANSNAQGISLSANGSATQDIRFFVQSGEVARMSSARNLLLGLLTDAGYRLDVGGTSRFVGPSANDSTAQGGEILTSTGWTSTDWTGDFATGFTHTTGNTTALSNTYSIGANNWVLVSLTITNRTAGSVTVTLGGGTLGPYTATTVVGLRGFSTGALSITPTTDFNGTVVVSIKSAGGVAATSTWTGSAGAARMEIRTINSTDNTLIGVAAGARMHTSAVSNTIIGSQAGSYQITGTYNTYVGAQAGQYATNAFNNTFVGAATGVATYNTSYSIYIGVNAGYNVTSGVYNTYIGVSAGNNNTAGTYNNIIGGGAFATATSGNYNVGLGHQVLAAATSATATVAIGYQSAFSGVTTVTNSIFLGYNTRPAGDAQTNQIVIGYNVAGLGSNTTLLGNSSTTLTALYGSTIVNGTSIQASAVLQADSTTKGFLPPRMTAAQRTAISSPATGLVVYQTDGTEGLYIKLASGWKGLVVA